MPSSGESHKAGLEPVSGRIDLSKYGSESRESDFSEDTVEIFRPIDTLKDFPLLHLPGINPHFS